MGSDSKNSNVQGGGGGMPVQIPAASKKIVQNLREVVGRSCTDTEIYSVLLECNMEPDDAVQRLLSQDTFHEVKSKRERRKELKETQESRAPRCNSGTSNRVARLGNEYAGGRTENNCNELGKAAYKREIASAASAVSSSSSHVYRAAGKTTNGQPSALSNFFNADDRRQSIGTGDTISSSVQQPPALQSARLGVSRGHVSMADVVRRGKPQSRDSQTPSEIPSMPHHAASTNSSHYSVKSAQTLSLPESAVHKDPHSPYPSNQSEMIHGSRMIADQHEFDGEWPVIEDLTATSGSSAVSDAEVYSNHPCLYSDRATLSRNSQPNKVPVLESDLDNWNLNSTSNGSASASTGHFFANVGGGASDDDLLKETSSHESHGRISKPQEGMGNGADLPFPNRSASFNDNIISAVSSTAVNLLQLNIGKEEPAMCPPEDKSAVVLPNFLQAFASDCSHLSFGTYKSGAASASSMPISSNPTQSDLEVSAAAEASSVVHLNIRNSEYPDPEHRNFMYDTPRSTAEIRNYESLGSSQSELRTEDTSEASCRHPYISQLLAPDSGIKNIQQSDPNSSFGINPNARDFPSSMSEMSLRARESSQFHATQSLSSRYSSAMASIGPTNPMSEVHVKWYSSAMASIGPTNPMSEVLNSGTFSLPQLSSQGMPVSNLVNETAVPRVMSQHPYSQPTLPLEELANLIGYPSIPQNQAYVPSALQQAYQDSNTFHDSLAGMNYNLPQYRSGAIMSSMPMSNDTTSGYRSFVGNSTNIHGNFLHKLSTSPTGGAVSYDDLLHSQYRDGNSFTRFQQNIRPSSWDSGISLQTTLHPESAYYSLLGQNSEQAGYRHAQQASQHYESLGYPNMYHSQMDQTRTSVAKPW